MPFLNQNLYLMAPNGTATIANPENLSSTFRDYLGKTLEVDAEKRPDATQLLQHPFFAMSEPLRTLAPLIKAALLHSLSQERTYDTNSPSLSSSPPQRSRSQSRPRLETPAPERTPYTRHSPVRNPLDNWIRRGQEDWAGKYNLNIILFIRDNLTYANSATWCRIHLSTE